MRCGAILKTQLTEIEYSFIYQAMPVSVFGSSWPDFLQICRVVWTQVVFRQSWYLTILSVNMQHHSPIWRVGRICLCSCFGLATASAATTNICGLKIEITKNKHSLYKRFKNVLNVGICDSFSATQIFVDTVKQNNNVMTDNHKKHTTLVFMIVVLHLSLWKEQRRDLFFSRKCTLRIC